jgi:CPA2 family monovalent cation:H+ antiporter-2
LLGPGGEFAFVSISMATGLNLIDPGLASFTLAVTSVTMVLIPLLSFAGRRFAARLRARAGGPVASELTAAPTAPEQRHAIVVGYGRVGKVVSALLKQHNIPYIAADSDAAIVTHDRRDGLDVYYGDASDPNFLEVCGLSRAAGVIITIHNHDLIDDIVEHVRTARPALPAPATPFTPAIFMRSAPPTPCRRPSRRACSSPKPRWWNWACPPDW